MGKEKFTDYLQSEGLLAEKQLKSVLAAYKKKGGSLVGLLIKVGQIEESQLVNVLSSYLSIPPIRISGLSIAKEIISLVPERVAKEYNVLPIGKIGNILTLAMGDPLDVLAIDDIHFLAEREASQEEFFHTFNTLYQSHKQIILSADSAPNQIPSLEERLISRFNWGLVARIDRPSYETRVAIVHKKAQLRGLHVPDDVVCLIATKVDSNTRELEGALTKVVGWAAINSGVINIELARQALSDPDVGQTQEVSIQQIFDAVTSRFKVRLTDLQGKRRTKSIAYPRQVCMHLARHLTRHSLEEIGGYFGGRDHTTVLYAVRTIEQQRGYDSHLQALLQEICHNLGGVGLDHSPETKKVSGKPVT